MIAFGVAPGIKSLAYCALEWDGAGPAVVLDQDVLSKSRLVKGNPHPAMLQKRFSCHRLILTTVWDRHIPTVLAIGPQADQAEPALNARLAAAILADFGRLMGVRVVQVDRIELDQAFGIGSRRTLRRALREYVTGPVPNDQRGVLAIAAAVYAGDSQLVRA